MRLRDVCHHLRISAFSVGSESVGGEDVCSGSLARSAVVLALVEDPLTVGIAAHGLAAFVLGVLLAGDCRKRAFDE